MANDSLDLIRLQLAMAFGQGAGSMLANPEALEFLLSEHAGLLRRAGSDWEASKFAFVELIRILGQIAAARAAMDNVWQIEKRHVEKAISAVLIPCPCFEAIRKD